MIKTSMQLKALVRNMSKSNSEKAQALLRHYAMERFLERISLSEYKENLILKGGTLISSSIDYKLLKEALDNTSKHRGTLSNMNDIDLILSEIKDSSAMIKHWTDYQKRFEYAIGISFDDTVYGIERLFSKIMWNGAGGENQ